MKDLRRALDAIVLAALALRLVLLLARGDYLVYDEAYYLLLERSLRAGHGFALSGLAHVSLSPLQPLVVAALALLGVPDLFASRLLAAACGALTVVPVAALARRLVGDRAALVAAMVTAASPALLALLPFFPGERWNLYFGSEPLFLLLATSALVAARAAVDEGRWRWWIALGVLAAAAYLTRLEGAVLGAGLAVVVLGMLVVRRDWGRFPRACASLAVAGGLCAPYLAYLHASLGRWAVSGRVQAAVAAEPGGGDAWARPVPVPPGQSAPGALRPPESGPRDAVRAFVWGGDQTALWRALYALDASGTQMASQYWGVPHRGAPAPRPAGVDTAPRAPLDTPAESSRENRPAGALKAWRRALAAVLPWWFVALAAAGAVVIPARLEAAVWLFPLLLAGVLPSLLAYVEPRSMLPLVPAACILAAAALDRAVGRLRAVGSVRWVVPALVAAVTVPLLVPTGHDLVRSWGQRTPLQQVASGRRAVGEYLRSRLPEDAVVVSWHPAVAVFAGRDWRVLPYDSFSRILGYARVQRADAVVFSTFEPSPLRDAPRAFTVVLVDSAAAPPSDNVRIDAVDQTPLLLVGRLAAEPPP